MRTDFSPATPRRRGGVRALTTLAIASIAIGTLQAEDTRLVLEEATIAEVARAMDAGALSSVELTALYLNRIYAHDINGARLNSIPVINPDALEDAEAADRLRAQGRVLGSMHGVPYTIKDSFKAKGMTVAAGSPAFASLIANEDAFTVQALRTAGGVLIGKTNMPPLAAGGMQRGLYGRAESPYNPDYLTAAWGSGSSNGSGTSTAANFAMFSLGEETVSSGRAPASNNALVAYTPSRGLISIRGNWPLYPVRDVVVPMARTMSDLFAVLDVVVADDPVTRGDFWRDQQAVALPLPSALRPPSFHELADTGALAGKRIGVPRLYIGKDETSTNPVRVRPSVLALWNAAAADLAAQGATVVEVDFPVIHNYELDRPGAVGYVERGLVPEDWWPTTSYVRRDPAASRRDWEFSTVNPYSWEAFLQSCEDPNFPSWRVVDTDLVFPVQPGSVDERRRLQAPPRSNTYAQAVAAIEAGIPHPTELPNFDAAMRGLETIRKIDFEDWMAANDLDFMVMPANADVGRANADVDEASYAHATSNGVARSNTNRMLRHLGIPSVSVPMGFMADIGMPVNLTFFGAAYSDNALLSYAYAYEQATRHRRPPARIASLADETIVYSAATAIPVDRRDETLPPGIEIDPAAIPVEISSRPAVRFTGTASDASGVATLRVYVNGHKVAEGVAGHGWAATVTEEDLAGWKQEDDASVKVLVLAKDRWGNASAQLQAVALPGSGIDAR